MFPCLTNFQRYGQETNTYMQSPMTWKVKPSNQHGERSHVTFLFRYRSPGEFGEYLVRIHTDAMILEWLMAQGIISAKAHVQKSLSAKRRVVSAPVAQLVNAPITPSPSPPNSKKPERFEQLVSVVVSSYHTTHIVVYPVERRTPEWFLFRTRPSAACTQCQNRERRGSGKARPICRGKATRFSS
jgi:hypothetical protein